MNTSKIWLSYLQAFVLYSPEAQWLNLAMFGNNNFFAFWSLYTMQFKNQVGVMITPAWHVCDLGIQDGRHR